MLRTALFHALQNVKAVDDSQGAEEDRNPCAKEQAISLILRHFRMD
jgi:hypothetical protein